jgi:hypothetical protein
MKPDCYQCKYRGTIPGDAHSCCNYPGTKTGILDYFVPENQPIADNLKIRANYIGIKKGWFHWPVNFDPVWLENCEGFCSIGGDDK